LIRQIRKLTRIIRVDGQAMPVVGVYMTRRGDQWRLDDADDTGYEGVACVDDVARAAMLFLEAWRRHGLAWARDEGCAYLRFLLYMQQPDGRFANFILNWQGEQNLTGPTSVPHGPNWNARALRALALAAACSDDRRYRAAFERSLEPVTAGRHYADIRALHVLAALALYEQTREAALRRRIVAWCDEIAGLRDRHGRLLNWWQEYRPHLWGYVQPAALALAGRALRRGDWLRLAEETMLRYLAPIVRAGFPQRTAIAYEVSSVIANLEALAQVSEDRRYRELLFLARAWFRGRNAAHRPVYEPIQGTVSDGIDDGELNPNSGAESNIEGALALLDDLPWPLYAPTAAIQRRRDSSGRTEAGRKRPRAVA
jgi:hypothetical protein